jgi:glycosidase
VTHRAALIASCLALASSAVYARQGSASLSPVSLADEVLYQIMPIAWRDADNDELRYGDFAGMTAGLDYLRDLGVTGVWMTPIFPSPAYHGYQHMEADKVNPRLGTEAQFLDFVKAAHDRGMKVFIDFVAYGINQESSYFQDAHNNPASPYTSWLAFKDPKNESYQGYTFRTWNGSEVGFVHWNLNSPEPRKLVTDWAVHWLDPNADGDTSDGVDGFRLDHVWYEYKEGPNGWGYSIKDFWTPWKTALRKVNPRVVTFAEQAEWETTGARLIPAFDAAFTKPFETAARDAIRTGKADALYDSIHEAQRGLQALPRRDRGTYLAILGDHDVDRLASAVEPSKNPDPAMRRPKLGAFILMTQLYPPVVYMGDEIGMLGVRRKGSTDANDIPVREPFKWKAVASPPMSDYWQASRQAVEGAFSKDSDGRSVEEQAGVKGSLLETYRRLIALRRASAALRNGEYISLKAEDAPSLWLFLRRTDDEMVLVAANLADAPATTRIRPPRMIGRWEAWNIERIFDLTTGGGEGDGATLKPVEGGASLNIPPLGAAIFHFGRAPAPSPR